VSAASSSDGENSEAPEEAGRRPTEPSRADGVDGGFVSIYEKHYPRLVRALELAGVDRTSAPDVAQEAFARMLGHWARVRRGTNPAGYVYRVAFRLSRRDRHRDLAAASGATSPDIAGEVALSLDIEHALQAMPAAQRRCAVLCLAVGLSTKDAARALGIAESTVRKQIERARGDLRAFLGDLS
jgi:RNA polymerase sigma-70 factor (ECF subfamily)